MNAPIETTLITAACLLAFKCGRPACAPARARYNAVFEEGKREGAVREDLDGASMLDTLRGAVMFHTLLNPTVDPAQLTSQLTDLVLHGVSPTNDVAAYEQEPAP